MRGVILQGRQLTPVGGAVQYSYQEMVELLDGLQRHQGEVGVPTACQAKNNNVANRQMATKKNLLLTHVSHVHEQNVEVGCLHFFAPELVYAFSQEGSLFLEESLAQTTRVASGGRHVRNKALVRLWHN